MWCTCLPKKIWFDIKKATVVINYFHSRTNNWIANYSEDSWYLFYCLDWLEEKVVKSTKQSVIHKHFQSDISVGQLTNIGNVRNIITDDQLSASSKNMLQESLGHKVKKYGLYTFFTCSMPEFK